MESKQLRRSSTNTVLAGVCGGLGEYFDADPTIIRIVFVLFTFFGGSGVLLYIVLWLIMPKDETSALTKDGIANTVGEMREKATDVLSTLKTGTATSTRTRDQQWFAFLLVALGALFLFRNFGLLDIFSADRMWPLVLIVIGIVLLYKRR